MAYDHDDGDATQRIPGSVRLKFGIVREFTSIHSLCLCTLVEANVSDTDPEPSYETRNRRHVGEPGENRARTSFDTHEAKKCKE